LILVSFDAKFILRSNEEEAMQCLNCGGEKFEEKMVRVSPKIKGEEVEVVAHAFVCEQCVTPLMDDTQMNKLRRMAADKYRATHHL
jgi:YgiT-type zinc finger domain-containing protein